jgi:hypothetical protein
VRTGFIKYARRVVSSQRVASVTIVSRVSVYDRCRQLQAAKRVGPTPRSSRELAWEEARTDGRAARERKEQERRIHRIYEKQQRRQRRRDDS